MGLKHIIFLFPATHKSSLVKGMASVRDLLDPNI